MIPNEDVEQEVGRSPASQGRAAGPTDPSPQAVSAKGGIPNADDFINMLADSSFGAGNPDCSDPECGFYPLYGVAPHECFYKRGPEFKLGQSLLRPREEWPDNFVLDVEPGEGPATIAYPNACGVFFCPSCHAGQTDMQERMDANAASGMALREDSRSEAEGRSPASLAPERSEGETPQ